MATFPSWDKNAHWVRVYRARIRLGLERCRLCGARNKWGTAQQLTLDHIHPRSLGGPSLMENATILCAECNCRKSSSAAVYKTSLFVEEVKAPRSQRWSQFPVPEVPRGPWDEVGASRQPPRTLRAWRRALARALPSWAQLYAVAYDGEELPDYVCDILAAHHGGVARVPQPVRSLMLQRTSG